MMESGSGSGNDDESRELDALASHEDALSLYVTTERASTCFENVSGALNILIFKSIYYYTCTLHDTVKWRDFLKCHSFS